jgi:3-oxoacyl-[acyl-carrier-protein] synthase II
MGIADLWDVSPFLPFPIQILSATFTSYISTAEAVCALGSTLADCADAVRRGDCGLRPLGELVSVPGLETLPSGWIQDRALLKGRRYGVATNVAQTNWTPDEIASAWIFAGTSRGNAMEVYGHTAWRRPVGRFAASNTLPSEIPAAISIELGIQGPWQLLSNACAAGLDALGMAHLALASGACQRALVVAVELPLVPELLRTFQQSGLLSKNRLNDPYHPATSGLLPAEAAAAVTLEAKPRVSSLAKLCGYWASSDAYHPLAVPADGRGLRACLDQARAQFPDMSLGGICPHATGTAEQGRAEQAVLQDWLQTDFGVVPLSLLKPFTGHSLGASGLLEVALMTSFLKQGKFPPNLAGLSGAGVETTSPQIGPDQFVLKMASGMGGHNALVALQRLGFHQGEAPPLTQSV